MAFQVTMTKENVSQLNAKVYVVTVKATISDGEKEVFSGTYSVQHNTNLPDMTGVKNQVLEQLQADWDKYQAEEKLKASAAFDTALTSMKSEADNYTNKKE